MGVGTFLPSRYASMDLCCFLSSSSCSSCSIRNLPNRSRFILRWYASRYLWYFQLHACIPSRAQHPNAPIPHAWCCWCIRWFTILSYARFSSNFFSNSFDFRERVTKLRLQVRSRRRDLQHRCSSRLLRSSNFPIRFIQQLTCTSLLPWCMASSWYLVHSYGCSYNGIT